MKTFKQFLLAESQWIGMCDKVRHDDAGEQFWQNMMRTRVPISEEEFLAHINPERVLDYDETWEEWIENNRMMDPDLGFYVSEGGIYFIQVAGFEYIWKA